MTAKYICIPDSFKGSLNSRRISDLMRSVILERFPEAEVLALEVADGGEGTVDAFLANQPGTKIPLRVQGPYFEPVDAFWGHLVPDVGIIEMAAAAGLPLVRSKRNPEATTTFGVGELMLDALDHGCHTLILGLGGSATNDGGCGVASALGVRFMDDSGAAFVPTGGTLNRIAKIDASGLDPRIRDTRIITMCDVENPLTGPTGAAAVFGPQKGADPAMVERLDQGLIHLAQRIRLDLGQEVKDIQGAGAAGGMGAGSVAFFGSELKMGIETILDLVGFDALLKGADRVFSGEGRFDSQSLYGKVVSGIARRTKARGVPLTLLVGDIGILSAKDQEKAHELGLEDIVGIHPRPFVFEAVKDLSEERLKTALREVLDRSRPQRDR